MLCDKFMPEMHLWDPKVRKYSACGPFTRHQKRIGWMQLVSTMILLMQNIKTEQIEDNLILF